MERDENAISSKIIGAAIEIHRHLGPGLLESSYECCLLHELKDRGLHCQQQVFLPVVYKNIRLDAGYRLDLLVEDKVIVEVKVVEELHPIHHAQVLTYLKLSNKKLGLLMNFNVPLLRSGLHRIVNGL